MPSYLSHNYIFISILTDPTENDGNKGKCFFFRKKIKSEVKFKHKRMYSVNKQAITNLMIVVMFSDINKSFVKIR